MNESTTMHGPAETAPAVSGKVAHCRVCKTQWQILSMKPPHDDAKVCPFCGAGKGLHESAVYIEDESTTRW